MQIRIIREMDELKTCADEWNKLLNLMNNTNPYLTLDWIQSWWCFFGKGRGLYIIMLTDDMGTAGFFPLMTRKRRFCTEYRFLTCPQGSLTGFVVRPGCEDSYIDHVAKHLRSIRGGPVFSLEGMNGQSPCCRRLLAGLGARAVIKTIPSRIIRLNRTSRDEYFEHIKQYRTVRQVLSSEKALASAVDLRLELAAPDEAEKIFPLHEKRWSQKNDGNGFGKGVSRRFFAHIAGFQMPDLPISFRVLLYLLKAGDTIIGFSYDLECNGHLTCYRIAHDDDYAVYRPGLIVVKKTMEKYFELGYHTVDFAKGDDRYKHYWADETETIYHIIFGGGTLLSRAAVALEGLSHRVHEALKKFHVLVRFKHVTIGKIKHFFTGAPVRAFFAGLGMRVGQQGVFGAFYSLLAPLVTRLGGTLLYAVKWTDGYWQSSGFTVKTVPLNEAIRLCDRLLLSPGTCSRRYKNGHICRLLYDGERLLGCVWISQKEIADKKRVLWSPARLTNRCFYDMQLFRQCKKHQRQKAVLSLVSPSLPGKNPVFFLLIGHADRKIKRVADRIFDRQNACLTHRPPREKSA